MNDRKLNHDRRMEDHDGEYSKRHQKPSPYLKAGLLSRLLLWWVRSLFSIAHKRTLTDDDVFDVPPAFEASSCVSHFERHWSQLSREKQERHGSLLMQLLICFKGRLAITFLVQLFVEVLRFLQPLLTAELVVHMHENIVGPKTYFYFTVLMVSFILISLITNHLFMSYDFIAMGMRTTCSAMIYKKVLCMSNQARCQHGTGQIVTLMSTDVEHFTLTVIYLHTMIFGPLWIIAFLSLQAGEIKMSALISLVVIVIFVVLQIWNGKTIGKLRNLQETQTGKRVHLMSEIITAMRVIKMYCWEKPFAKKAEQLRKSEMKINQKRLIHSALTYAMGFAFGNILVYIITMSNVLIGIPIYPERNLKILGGIKMMQFIAFIMMPFSFYITFQCLTATERIKEFLMCEELVQSQALTIEDESQAKISLEGVSATWNSEDELVSTLRNIHFSANSGALVGITGKVGSGKSSLLMAMIGELPVSEGTCILQGKVAYVSQESWVLSESLRMNIILDSEFNEEKYNAILKACSIDEDIQQFPQGDLTLVGERGLSLSGGQKSRVTLARAMYQDGDIYLFDDPLAAVDYKVGNKIFKECICGLLKGKLRILVTHHLQYLKDVDTLLILEKGEVIESVESEHVTESLRKYIHGSSEETGFQSSTEMEREGNPEVPVLGSNEAGNLDLGVSGNSSDIMNSKQSGDKRMAVLQMETGQVSNKVYWSFISNGDTTTPANMSTNYTEVNPMSGSYDDQKYMLVVGILALIILVAAIVQSYLYSVWLRMSSQNVYNTMFRTVLRAPTRFFETNPVGQILNRFSRDTGFMDVAIFHSLFTLIQVTAMSIAYIIFACVILTWLSIGAVILLVLMGLIFRYTIPCIRDMRRIEGRRRSPTYSHLSATLQGLPVIRALQKQEWFLADAYSYMDEHTGATYFFLVTQRVMAIAISFTVAVFGMAFTAITLFTKDQDTGGTGIAINNFILLLALSHHAFQMMAEIEMVMTSVERIQQFSTIEMEAPEHTALVPSTDWPSQGHIKFINMSVTYKGKNTPAVGPISLEIKPREKVGVVGRTGAGKSSLFTGLLRLVEPTGRIEIDGIDVTKIGLDDLRSKISVIPQDPVLFSGSLRFNLDPFDEFSAEQHWTALNQVQLASYVKDLAGGLSADMGEAGSNFSVGERQLLCMARALLRQNKIIIIDEATANVDSRTDAIIQETLSREFVDSTVLTIAHRLNTIITYDKILVLDKGCCTEFGHPHELLRNQSGMFHQMVQRLGSELSSHLQELSAKSYKHDDNLNLQHNQMIESTFEEEEESKEKGEKAEKEGGYLNLSYL